MLSTLGIFSALAFSVSEFVPGYIGLLLSILFALIAVVFLVEILKDLIDTRLIVSATGKLFGTIILFSVFLLLLNLLLYTYTEAQDSLVFYLFLALLIFITTMLFIYGIFINYGYENKFFEKPIRASKVYKFLCCTILIVSFLISYVIYKNFDNKIKNHVQNNYSLVKTKSLK